MYMPNQDRTVLWLLSKMLHCWMCLLSVMPFVHTITECNCIKSMYVKFNNNNNNNFLCANILENQAQWRDKTQGLSNCVNVEQCVSR